MFVYLYYADESTAAQWGDYRGLNCHKGSHEGVHSGIPGRAPLRVPLRAQQAPWVPRRVLLRASFFWETRGVLGSGVPPFVASFFGDLFLIGSIMRYFLKRSVMIMRWKFLRFSSCLLQGALKDQGAITLGFRVWGYLKDQGDRVSRVLSSKHVSCG